MKKSLTYYITIPDGYRIIEEERNLDLGRAASLLQTKRRRRYTSALRVNEIVMLKRHIFICPHCRRTTPAYAEFFHPDTAAKCNVTRSDVKTWSSQQISFFNEDTDLLQLNIPLNDSESHICPRCGGISTPFSGKEFTVRLEIEGNRIILSHATFNPQSLIDLTEEDTDISFCPPISENIVFDLATGRTHLRLSDAKGNALGEWDIARVRSVWEDCKLYSTLQNNTLVRRRLRSLFEQQTQSAFPFMDAEQTPDHFLLFTLFQGYPRNFYDAVPFSVSTGEIDESFAEIIPALRNAKDIPALYDSLEIPKMKSVRRIFFANPGLFFYSEECIKLWQVIRDLNFFCAVLGFSHIYDILSFMHQFPSVMDFFTDYGAQHGEKALKALLKDFSDCLKHVTIQYGAMNPAARKNHGVAYTSLEFDLAETAPPPIAHAYSIPMRTKHPIPCSTVNGYSVVRLSSLRDYTIAAEALKNCLGENYRSYGSVYVIKRCGKIQAAIEVRSKTVTQARCFNNAPIEFYPNLYATLKRWVKHNSICILWELFDDLPGE